MDIQEFDGTWVVDAPWLQRLIANVNFGDYESRNWFDQKLRQSGLFDKLEEMGIKDGDIVSMYDWSLNISGRPHQSQPSAVPASPEGEAF